MAARNPFELLVDNDSEDPSLQLKEIEKKKPVVFPGNKAVAKSSSKPIAPSKTGKSDARGGARSNGHGRGAGGMNHKDNRDYGNNNNRSYAPLTEEQIAKIRAEIEEDAKKMTLAEYEKSREEKKKAVQAASRQTDDTKVVDKDFETMKKVSSKKTVEDVFIVKPTSENEKKKKKKQSPEKNEKAGKKSFMSITEFLKSAEGEKSNDGGQSGTSAQVNANGVSEKDNGVALEPKGAPIRANPWSNANGANVPRVNANGANVPRVN